MRDALKVYAPIALLVLALTIIAMRMVAPPPPKSIVFAAGGADGQYYALAEQYAEALSVHGIEVTVLETRGTVENYQLLAEDADVAFLQGGLATAESKAAFNSLGGMFVEPLWLFVNAGTEVESFAALQSANIGAGRQGSGTRALVELLIAEWGGDWSQGNVTSAAGASALAQLQGRKIDVAAFSASIEAPYVQAGLRNPNYGLVSLDQVNGLSMRNPALTPVTLYHGVVDFDQDLPRQDVQLVASVAQLGVRKDLHPAIQSVLLEAAERIHADGNLLTRAGTFPDAERVELPLSEEARRYYRSGPTFLRRYFSFGWANFLERAWVFLLPLVAALIPLVQMAPPIYRWRIRRKIYVWYNDLHELERRGIEAETKELRQGVLEEIHELQMEVGTVDVPVSYNDELYHLRSHINFVEALIARQKVAVG
jgi:TRAP-type uncharacterized transport system substrate-binding protein